MINTGHGNYNTEQQTNLYIDKGQKYSPDKVVLFYFINDAEVTPKQSDYQWLAYSRAITFFWSRLRGVFTKVDENQTFEGFYSALYEDDQPGWMASKASFIQLRDLLKEQGVDFQVVMLPELHNVQEYPFDGVYDKVYNFLVDSDIEVLDLREDFSTYPDDSLTLWAAPDDAHPNAIAHKMIADYSYEFVGKGILDKDRGDASE